ncbi:terpene synthase family protein [Streptomyces sp. NPDC056500]|uniref:terpene synthase family protein n=1 Tax=Streptomyces sp. NPDC056500 TaxID=3345840 RepID=UPI00369D1B17
MTASGKTLTIDVNLDYPAAWLLKADPLKHIAPEHDLNKWMNRYGLLPNQESRTRSRKTHNGHCSVDCFPRAAADRLSTVTRFLGLWFLYEDASEGHDADTRATSIGQAVGGFLKGHDTSDLWMQAWSHIGEEFTQSMSEAWRARFARHFESWQQSVKDEANLFHTYGAQVPAIEYTTVRHHSIGLYTWVDLIEFTAGRELPTPAFWDPDVIEIWQIAREISILQNDLYGVSKDAAAGWCNLVFSVAHERDMNWGNSCRHLAAEIQRLIKRCHTVETRIRSGGLGIEWWLDALKHLLAGLLIWTNRAPRYSSLHRQTDGTNIRIKMTWTPETKHANTEVLSS